MIFECREDRFNELTSFCWNIAKDKTQYGFPRFESFQQLSQRFLNTLQHPDDKLLAYYEDEKLIAVLNLFVERKDHYLQAIGGVFTTADFHKVTDLFIEYLQSNYPGYDFHIGFPVEHVIANQYFKEMNATRLDASLTMKLIPQNFINYPVTDAIVKVDKHNINRYVDFHDKHFGSFYWNSTRILEKFEYWHIFYLQQHEIIKGSIFIRQNTPTQLEVYGLIVEEDTLFEEFEFNILYQSLAQTLTHQTEDVLFFIDEDNESQHKACLKIGFKQIDTYRSYKISL